MVDLLNNKLYTRYYPLRTEEDKEEFLNSNYAEIYKEVRKIENAEKNELYVREYRYVENMKPTVSFWGTPKYKNISYNRYVEYKMATDRRINEIKEKMPELNSLVCKLMHYDHENITIDEMNYVLTLMNANKHKLLIMLFALMISIIICVCAYL